MSSDGFDPTASKYRACCCHVKTFTIIFGILEIFAICFLLVAVLPDVNSRVCVDHPLSNNNTFNREDFLNKTEFEEHLLLFESFFCDMNVIWLIWSIGQLFFINVMFFGIKNIRWIFFVPHMVLRCICLLCLAMTVSSVIFMSTIAPEPKHQNLVTSSVLLGLLFLFYLYVYFIQFRCLHFVKRSQETGFSISVTRPIGPATISLSETQPVHPQSPSPPNPNGPQARDVRPNSAKPAENGARALPPLRHTGGRVGEDKESR